MYTNKDIYSIIHLYMQYFPGNRNFKIWYYIKMSTMRPKLVIWPLIMNYADKQWIKIDIHTDGLKFCILKYSYVKFNDTVSLSNLWLTPIFKTANIKSSAWKVMVVYSFSCTYTGHKVTMLLKKVVISLWLMCFQLLFGWLQAILC